MIKFFNSKKKPSVVWRTAEGKIKCQGDSCPQKCDETCPIWCQTMALTMMNMGQLEKAIEEYKKALTIAPDFVAAWNNLAATYGNMNNHMEAYKAYMGAYAADNNNKNALYGLIISSKNLGQYEQALKYCDEYAQKVSKSEAESLRTQVIEMQKTGNAPQPISVYDMAQEIVAHAREEGILGPNDHFPNIPEIMAEAKITCYKILKDILKDKDTNDPYIWLAWGAYAGIGAVCHWNDDWNNLKSKGIAETLLEPRGSFAMDEYVIDLIGITFESKEGKKFSKAIYDLSKWAFVEFADSSSKEAALRRAMEIMNAMYMFGMVYEMERLGMR